MFVDAANPVGGVICRDCDGGVGLGPGEEWGTTFALARPLDDAVIAKESEEMVEEEADAIE